METPIMTSLYFLLLAALLSPLLVYFFLFFSEHKKAHLPLPPGPLGYPILGNLPQLGTKPHQTLHALSLTYGPLLRLRFGCVNVIVASSASVASLLLKTHDANFSNRPFNAGAKYLAYGGRNVALAPYGPRWRALRKIGNMHLFSAKALDASRLIREDEIKTLVAGLAACCGPAIEVGSWVNACVADIMGRVLVGKKLFVVRSGGSKEVREFKEMAVEIMKLLGEPVIGDFVPGLGWMDLGGVVGRMKRLAKRVDEFLDGFIKEHVEDGGEEEEDMLSVLIGLKENGVGEDGKVTDEEIKAFLADMFIAGTDTSSSTVEWALSELIRHPNFLHQAQQELDSVVGQDRLVSESDIANLPFLQAIIKETFRLHPSTPLLLPRIASDSVEINGYHIPKNSTLMVNAWAIGRDPNSWTQPLEFRPERFLPGGEHEFVDVKGNDFEIIPFGAGRRICGGLSLGLRMVQLMTGTLINAFDWALPIGQVPEKLSMEEAFGLTLQRVVPLKMCPKPRLAPHVYGSARS